MPPARKRYTAVSRSIGTDSHLRQATQGRAEGTGIIYFPRDGDRKKVRFLVEPLGFREWLSHYDQKNKTGIPCVESDCPRCEDGHRFPERPSKKWFAPIVDVDEKEVRVVQIPVSLLTQLRKFYELDGTICDRDYVLMRDGKGQTDTTYTAMPRNQYRMDFRQFPPPGSTRQRPKSWTDFMGELLDAMIPENQEGGDEEEERRPESRRGRDRGSHWHPSDGDTIADAKAASGWDEGQDEPPFTTSRRKSAPPQRGRTPSRRAEVYDDDEEEEDEAPPSRRRVTPAPRKPAGRTVPVKGLDFTGVRNRRGTTRRD